MSDRLHGVLGLNRDSDTVVMRLPINEKGLQVAIFLKGSGSQSAVKRSPENFPCIPFHVHFSQYFSYPSIRKRRA